MGDNVAVKKLLQHLRAHLGVDPSSSESAEKAQERARVKAEVAKLTRLKNESPDLENLDISALLPLIKKGFRITDVYKGGDLFTIEYVRRDGVKGEMFQEEGAPEGEVFVKSTSSHDEAATVRVKTIDGKRRYVEEKLTSRNVYDSKGNLRTHENNSGRRDIYKNGKRLYSEDLNTGKRYFYFEGTDFVDFVEDPDGRITYFELGKKRFQVEFQPTNYKKVCDNKRLIAKPKLRHKKRLRAYKRKIRARVRETHVSSNFSGPSKVETPGTPGQVVTVSGVVLVVNSEPVGSLPGIFGLNEGLVTAFLKAGSVYSGSFVPTSPKRAVVDDTKEVSRVSDDVTVPRIGTAVRLIVLSEGAVLAMPVFAQHSSEKQVVERSERVSSKEATKAAKLKGAILRASYKKSARVGAPIMIARGSGPLSLKARHLLPKRASHVLKVRMSNPAPRTNLFRGSVLSAVSADQYILIPRVALPTIRGAAPVDGKTSVRETMRGALVEKPSRSQRDSSKGNGGHAHDGRDEQPKQGDDSVPA